MLSVGVDQPQLTFAGSEGRVLGALGRSGGLIEARAQGDDVIARRALIVRFDETTTSPNRPSDAPLIPSPRELRLIDSAGRQYPVRAVRGTPLTTPLTPASSYTTQLEFKVPQDARGLRLLVETVPDWPDRFMIGDENSLGHKKTYLAL